MTWMSWASSQEIKNNHFTSSCVISGAEFPELKRRKRQRGELWWSSEACLVYKKHERPANCVSLHSIDYLILQVKIWSIKSFGFFEGIAVQPFCVMVINLCVHLLSHRARSTLSNDAWTTAQSVEAKICLEWMDWLVCHWLLFLAIENENGNQRMCVSKWWAPLSLLLSDFFGASKMWAPHFETYPCQILYSVRRVWLDMVGHITALSLPVLRISSLSPAWHWRSKLRIKPEAV